MGCTIYRGFGQSEFMHYTKSVLPNFGGKEKAEVLQLYSVWSERATKDEVLIGHSYFTFTGIRRREKILLC